MGSLSLSSSPLAPSLLLPPALSLTCISHEFTNKIYANCTLPLSPWPMSLPRSGAWAINLVATGMVESQALMALRINGSIVVKAYNISSYHSIVKSKLSCLTCGA